MFWITRVGHFFDEGDGCATKCEARVPSSLEEVWLAKDLVGDVRSLWPLFLHYFRRRVLRCSLSWCRMLHFEEWTKVSLVSVCLS